MNVNILKTEVVTYLYTSVFRTAVDECAPIVHSGDLINYMGCYEILASTWTRKGKLKDRT